MDKQPPNTTGTVDLPRNFAPGMPFGLQLVVLTLTSYHYTQGSPQSQAQQQPVWPMNIMQGQFLYQPETLGNEFSVLTYGSHSRHIILSNLKHIAHK
jgi:hypothetical protein